MSINRYLVINKDDRLYFTTDSGVEYLAYFTTSPHFSGYPFEDYLFEFSFDLNIEDQVEKDKVRKSLKFDEKVKNTIVYIVSEFFEQLSIGILLFICDSLDGLHKSRQVTFNRYFKEFNDRKFEKHDYTLSSAEVTYYTSIVISKSHPDRTTIVSAFQSVGVLYQSYKV